MAVDEQWGPVFIERIADLRLSVLLLLNGPSEGWGEPEVDPTTWMNWVDQTFDRTWPFSLKPAISAWRTYWEGGDELDLAALHGELRAHRDFYLRPARFVWTRSEMLEARDPPETGGREWADKYETLRHEFQTFDWWLGRLRDQRRRQRRARGP